METILIINSISLWILLLFNILLTIGLARRINRQFLQFDFLKPGQPIPDFTAWTLQEETVTSEDYVAQRVALIFISPTCQPCREVIPEVESWQTEAQAQDLLLVFVSDASVAETKQFVAELNVTRPCLVAPRNRTSFLA
ncbi:MAG: redoxin domain-containing protein, partial [Chloroflexi bacterium]|nr:redoxin domain-containing protein [Chloroflexota bacterium]